MSFTIVAVKLPWYGAGWRGRTKREMRSEIASLLLPKKKEIKIRTKRQDEALMA